MSRVPTDDQLYQRISDLEYDAWAATQDPPAGCRCRQPASDLDGPVEGVCTAAEWLELQVSWFKSLGSPWSELLARHIQGLADDARFVGATQPSDVDCHLNSMKRIELALEDMAAMVKRASR